MLLDGLDKIDWANINHSHDRATEFPTWIRQLLSDVPEIRENAQEMLFEYSLHQGSIYEVTSYLVPFLIELVAAEDTPDRAALLNHLAQIGAASHGTDVESILGGDAHETHTRFEEGLQTYLALLADGDPAVRLAALRAAVVVRWPQSIWNIVDRFMATIARETDLRVKARMVTLLGHYAKEHFTWFGRESRRERYEKMGTFLLEQTRPEGDKRVRLNAALAYLEFFQEWTQEAAHFSALFEDVLRHPDAYSLSENHYTIRWVIDRTIEGLAHFPRVERMALLGEGVKAARYPDEAHFIGRALLDTIFYGSVRAYKGTASVARRPRHERRRLEDDDPAERPDNSKVTFREYTWRSQEAARQAGWYYYADLPEPDLTALSAFELSLLRLVLDTDMVWMVHSNLLALYGLPPTRTAARRLLDGETNHHAK